MTHIKKMTTKGRFFYLFNKQGMVKFYYGK